MVSGVGRRLVVVGVALGLLATLPACSSDEAAAPLRDDLVCVQAGIPCSWADVPDETARLAMDLLDDVSDQVAVSDGLDDLEALAAELEANADVDFALADETGLQFRVEGAPVMVAHAPIASPFYVALAELAAAGDLATALAADDEQPDVPSPESTGAAADAVVASSFEVTRAPDLRPRSALLLRPYQDYDIEGVVDRLVHDRTITEEQRRLVDRDALLRRIDATASVFRDSDRYTLGESGLLQDWLTFRDQDVVIINTHSSTWAGNRDCDEAQGHVCGPVLGAENLGTAGQDAERDEALEAEMFARFDTFPPGATIGRIFDQWTIGVTPDFFRQQYGDAPLDLIVILNACKTGDESIPVTGLTSAVAALGDGGAAGTGSVFAWDNASDVISADVATSQLAHYLVEDALPADLAYDLIKAEPELVEHQFGQGPLRETSRLLHLGRSIRARDAVEARQFGAQMQPGAVIAVDGEAGDGTNDTIREFVVRLEGVLVDDEADVTLTWQLEGRHAAPQVLAEGLSSTSGTVVDVSDPDDDTDRWVDVDLVFTDLDLGFDLEDEDLVCCREQTLVVEVATGDGEESRHEITPVFLRQGTVEVLDPEFGQPLESEDHVLLDGEVGDGEAEIFPLIVNLEDIPSDEVDRLELVVVIGDEELRIPSGEWRLRDEEGQYRVERDVDLGDFDEPERSVVVRASVELPDRGSIVHVVDPLVLELDEVIGCPPVSGVEMTRALGVEFGDPENLGDIFGAGLLYDAFCEWTGDLSYVQIAVFSRGSAAATRANVEEGAPTAVEGFDDAAMYDVQSATPPSGIEIDGVMHWSNFVNLVVAVGDRQLNIHVQGNLVVDAGVDGLLARLQGLVGLLREKMT